MFKENYTLSNGVIIPKLGFGTWLIPNKTAEKAVYDAINAGYRHIDTAQAYGNETGVGIGIKNSNVPREELFVTTKLAAEIKNYGEALAAIDTSLTKLGLDYIDLMIIHSPQPWKEVNQSADRHYKGNVEVWRAFEEAYKAGKLRAIGVSNFEIDDLNNILNNCNVTPMVNQVLAHIGNMPFELIEFCQSKSILIEAYSPIAHGEILHNKEIQAIAEKYGVSIAQISIRYCLQSGLLPLPKASSIEHIKENASLEFYISKEDMQILKAIRGLNDYGKHSYFPVYGGKI